MIKEMKLIVKEIKSNIRKIFESTKFGLAIQSLIILSVLQLTIQTIPSYSSFEIHKKLELFFTIIFSVEYILRVYIAENKIKYIFSFFGLIDFLSILPSIISFGAVDMRFLRSFRLLRLFRILKLVRFTSAIDRINQAFSDIKDELLIFLFLTFLVLFISASGIYFFENEIQPDIFKSIPHSLWWAIATFTTVGYGDVYPVTIGGKIFTSFMLISGLGIVAVPAGLFASAFNKNKDK